MNETAALAELEDFRDVLAAAGYRCRIESLGRFPRVLLAENPYALVAAIDVESWPSLVEQASDLQAELTRLALEGERVSIRWDLYVLIHVRSPALQPVQSELLDRVESDTKYARKFVRVNLTRDGAVLDRALRSFLPLRSSVALDVVDPIDLVRADLIEQGMDPELTDHVVASFRQGGQVMIP